MRTRALACIALAAAVSVAAAAPSPSFLWSSPNVIKGETYVLNVISPADVLDVMKASLTGLSEPLMMQDVQLGRQATVALLFTVDEMSTADVSELAEAYATRPVRSGFQSLVAPVKSSVVCPYTASDASVDATHALVAVAQSLATVPDAQVVVATDKDVEIPGVQQVQLSGVQHIVSALQPSGRTIVVVNVPTLYDYVDLMVSLSDTAAVASVASYVGALMALTPSEDHLAADAAYAQAAAASHGRHLQSLLQLEVGAANATTEQVHMTPGIMSGLLISGFLLFLLTVGVTCMAGIMTPSQMPNNPPQVGREY